MDPSKPIRLSKHDAVIGGVCSGLAAWAGWHPSVVRVFYILVTALTGFVLGIVAYAVLWVFLPGAAEVQLAAPRAATPGESGPSAEARP